MSEVNLSESVCSAVHRFARDMQFKLDKNEHKPCPIMFAHGLHKRTWTDCDPRWLIRRARMELLELEEELERGDVREAQLECADVGNFMMMLHDNLNRQNATDQRCQSAESDC